MSVQEWTNWVIMGDSSKSIPVVFEHLTGRIAQGMISYNHEQNLELQKELKKVTDAHNQLSLENATRGSGNKRIQELELQLTKLTIAANEINNSHIHAMNERSEFENALDKIEKIIQDLRIRKL